MKKNIWLLLAGIVALGLATCSEDPEPVLKELTQQYWQAALSGKHRVGPFCLP
ncbi:hypothetical protein ES703_106315 [subsurface metagenome]